MCPADDKTQNKAGLQKQVTKRGLAPGNIERDKESDSIREQLRQTLTANAVRVIDLFREWDEEGNGTVSKKEFRKAMPMLGLQVPMQEVDALFDSWEKHGSGVLELKELSKVLNGIPAG